MARAQGGDEQAFEELFERFFPKIHGMLVGMIGDAAMAEDLAQQAMIKAWRNLKGFDRRSKFGTWLYRIALNCGRDYLRAQKSRPAPPPHDEGDDAPEIAAETAHPADALRGRELQRALAGALEKLSPEHREVFILGELQELPYEQVAELLRCKRGTVMSRMHYARRHLLKILAPYLTPEPAKDGGTL